MQPFASWLNLLLGTCVTMAGCGRVGFELEPLKDVGLSSGDSGGHRDASVSPSTMDSGAVAVADAVANVEADATVVADANAVADANIEADATVFADANVVADANIVADATVVADATIDAEGPPCGQSCVPDAGPDAALPNWTIAWRYRKRLVIQGGRIVGTETNFPVLVSFPSDASLRDHAAKRNGGDIFFMQDDTKLDHEVERFDAATGSLTAWVGLSRLDQGVDTNVFMYYGNDAALDQQNRLAVWDDNFISVHHLSSVEDSTSSRYDLVTSNGAMATFGANPGSIAGSATLDRQTLTLDVNHDGRADDYGTDDPAELDGISQLTLSAWVTMAQLSQYQPVVAKSGVNDAGQEDPNGWWMGSGGSLGGEGSDDMVFAAGTLQTNAQRTQANVLRPAGVLHYWTAVYDGMSANQVRLYLDGVEKASASIGGRRLPAVTPNTHHPVHIAPKDLGGATAFIGVIDEVRISNIPRNANWIRTEYNNQSDPASFVTAYPEESR